MRFSFERIYLVDFGEDGFRIHLGQIWLKTISFIIPFFVVSSFVAVVITFSQTTLNFSWERLKPDFSRMNPLKGLVKQIVGGKCHFTLTLLLLFMFRTIFLSSVQSFKIKIKI